MLRFESHRILRNMPNKKRTRLERLFKKEDQRISYLGPGICGDRVSSMFHRAFELVHDFPWNHLPPSKVPIYVDIPELGLKGAVLAKFKPRPGRHGLAIFPSCEQWEGWLKGRQVNSRSKHAWSRLILIFDERAPLTPTQRQNIKDHGWSMPTFYSYPDWFSVDHQGLARSIRKRELQILEATIAALVGSFYGEAKRAWIKIWEGVTPHQQFQYRVPCHRDMIEVIMRSRPLLAKPFPWVNVVRWDPGEHPRYELRALHKALYKHFRRSHEGYGEGAGEHSIETFLALVHNQLDCSIAQITPNQLEILITDEFYQAFKWREDEKREVMMSILERFFRYLKRNFEFDAGPFIERLGHRGFHQRLDVVWGKVA